MGGRYIRGTLKEKLECNSTYDPVSGCIVWQRARLKSGYGRLWHDGELKSTHRWAWMEKNGPIPDGMEVCHTCDNPPCINTNHLFLGTPADNMADRDAKGRLKITHHHGERNGKSKLTDAIVVLIRTDNRPASIWASELGVNKSCIFKVRRREIWRHVP